MNIEIFSVGGYSSWCYYAPDRILFDCGEGFATHFRNRVFAPERVVFSHQHSDHIGGIFQLLAARNGARGDKDKELILNFDFDNEYAKKYISFLKQISRSDKIVFEDLNYLSCKALIQNRYVDIFETKHSPRFKSHGFVVRETRSCLKEKYRGLDIKSCIANGQVDKRDLMEKYTSNVFAYTLDSYNFDIKEIYQAKHWVADCTFLKRGDMDGDSTHMCLEDVLAIRERANIKNVYLAHISSRYSNEDIRKLVLPEGVFPVYHGRVNRYD